MAATDKDAASYEVYFEAQDPESAICGRHAINNLLQGAYFTTIDLANIGNFLDEQEQKLLSVSHSPSGGNSLSTSPDRRGAASNQPKYSNVSMDGNFSIDVLISALNQLKIAVLPISHPECAAANENPTKEEGFIFYQMAHWIAYRRIHGVWYDLNSQSNYLLLDPQPVAVSDFFLSAQISKLQDEGFSVYVIRGLHRHSLGRLAPKCNDLQGEYRWVQSADIQWHVDLDKQSRAKQAEDVRVKTEQLRLTDPQQYNALMRLKPGVYTASPSPPNALGGGAQYDYVSSGLDALSLGFDPAALAMRQQREQQLAMQQIEADRQQQMDSGDGLMAKMANPLSKLKTFYNEKTTEIKRKLNDGNRPNAASSSSSPTRSQYESDLERAKLESLATAPTQPHIGNHVQIETVPSSTRQPLDDDVELALAISASIAANNGVIAQSPKNQRFESSGNAMDEVMAPSPRQEAHDFLNLQSMSNGVGMHCDEQKQVEVAVDDNDPFAVLIRQYSGGSGPQTGPQTEYRQNDKGDDTLFDVMGGFDTMSGGSLMDSFATDQDLNATNSINPLMNADASGGSADSMGSHGNLNALPFGTQPSSPQQRETGHVRQHTTEKVQQMEDDLWRMLEKSLTTL